MNRATKTKLFANLRGCLCCGQVTRFSKPRCCTQEEQRIAKEIAQNLHNLPTR